MPHWDVIVGLRRASFRNRSAGAMSSWRDGQPPRFTHSIATQSGRRLIVIACEDVGVGDIDALLESFLAAASTDLRRQCGEASVLGAVVRRLAEAVKDRSADYLACAAKDHSDLSEICDFCRKASINQRLQFLADTSQPLAKRAVAAWFASSINWRYDQQVRGGDVRALAATYRDLGVGEELFHSIVLAARKA